MKTCKQCETYKPLEEFGKGKANRGGYRPICKACLSHKKREKYAAANPAVRERLNERQRRRPGVHDRAACMKCGELKSSDAFGVNRSGTLRGTCKQCRNETRRVQYHADAALRELAVERSRSYRKKRSPEENQKWLDRTRDKRNDRKRLARMKKGRVSMEARQDRRQAKQAEKEMKAALDRAQRSAQLPHSAHVGAWKRARPAEHFRHRYRNDPEFNAKYKLRARLRKLATADGDLSAYMSTLIKKGTMMKRWQTLLGYTSTQLVAHLRRTLPRGTTWADFMHGRLHIDHILPRSSFDLTSIEEVKACWALSNLRLLRAEDNIKKRARLEFLV